MSSGRKKAYQCMIESDGGIYFATLLNIAVLEETYKVICYTDITEHISFKCGILPDSLKGGAHDV